MVKSVKVLLALGSFFFTGSLAASDFSLKMKERDLEVIRFKSYYYVTFDLKNPSSFTLVSTEPLNKVEFEPKSYQVPFQISGNSVEFRLNKPGYHLVRINDSIKVFILADRVKKIPSGVSVVNFISSYNPDITGNVNETQKIQQALDDNSGSGKVLFFPPGVYKSAQLNIKSDSKIFFSRGAVIIADTTSAESYFPSDDVQIRRFLYIGGAQNVEITGYGTIDGNGSVLRKKFGDDARIRLILAVRSQNIRIEGITLRDPGSWNTQILLCENVTFRNVKLLNDVNLSNTDGFDPDAAKDLLIENCFAYCGDDNVAVKTTGYSGLLDDIDNVRVCGNVFLTKKSALKIGTETRGISMRNITFKNNDVIECDRGIAVYVSDGAVLDNIRYVNNRFGRNYPDSQQKAIHVLVNKRNPDSLLGRIDHLMIRDCSFETVFPQKSVIKYDGEGEGINVTVKNLKIAGRKVAGHDGTGWE